MRKTSGSMLASPNGVIQAMLLSAAIVIVVAICGAVFLPSKEATDSWDRAEVIFGAIGAVAVPVFVGLGVAIYNNWREPIEEREQQLRYAISRIEVVRQLAPELLDQPLVKARLAAGVQQAGDEELARILGPSFLADLLKETSPEDLKRLRTDENQLVREFATQLLGLPITRSSPPAPAIEADYRFEMIEFDTPAVSVRFHDDPSEHRGQWVATRGDHSLDSVPRRFCLGKYLVTNEFYLDFIREDGYANDALWTCDGNVRESFRTVDGEDLGPSTWPTPHFPEGRERHPVAGICHYEAEAFCRWLQQKHPVEDWRWTLPNEDMWEYAARPEHDYWYPWGSTFRHGRANSSETRYGTTTDVNSYPNGRSRKRDADGNLQPDGCYDMAGNLWEFVTAPGETNYAVLRGGSFLNNEREIKTHLRLFGVPLSHRPPDFGVRCALVPDDVKTK